MIKGVFMDNEKEKTIEPFELPEHIQRLLSIMEYDVAYTGKALMEKLGLKSKEGFRRNYLIPAIEMKLIRMTVPEQPRNRNQRYIKC